MKLFGKLFASAIGIILVFSFGILIGYQNHLNISYLLSDKKDSEIFTVKNETQTNIEPLRNFVLHEVERVVGPGWDRKIEVSTLGSDGNQDSRSFGKWYANDAWDWIGWGGTHTDSWTILVSKDGFDCKQLEQIPEEIEENFKSIIYQNGKKYCYDRSTK